MAEPPEAWGPEAQLQRRRGNNKARSQGRRDRKSTRLNSSHLVISYAVFCLKKKKSHDGLKSSGLAICVVGLAPDTLQTPPRAHAVTSTRPRQPSRRPHAVVTLSLTTVTAVD